ncbi:MAG: 6-carboxytetrahydropterin synthase QueD [Elusimicrobia bacterium]|nr:6-carboxytetrahydropterin synthase QueD [Elusimicrobiota bacterium]
MNYKASVTKSFSAAHALNKYKGKCENLHGHNWKVKVSLSSNKLDKTGMVMDFTDIKAVLKSILSRLDHKYLNKVPPFDKINPTAENIAEYIFEKLIKSIKLPIKINEVEVWESETSSATVSR